MAKKSKVSDHNSDCDVAIVGGGMVGLSIALLLAHKIPDLHIAIIDAQALKNSETLAQPSFDARSTAISSHSVDILKAIGVWPQVIEHAAAINEVQVSDKGHAGQVAYSAKENGGKALGYVVENLWLGKALMAGLEGLRHKAQVRICAPAELKQLQMRQDGAALTITEGNSADVSLKARLVIAADGANSSVRRLAGIEVDRHDYQQVAMIANIESEAQHGGRAFERFTRDGPLALLPLVPNAANPKASRSSLVWTHPIAELEALKGMDDERCIAALQAAFGYRLGRITRIGERHYYPLEKVLAREQLRSRLVIMGNAAHYLHPVAGQGFNLALRDAECLVKVIVETWAKQEDIGALVNLKPYLHLQSADQATTVGASHVFNLLFSNAKPSAEVARNLGLMGMNLIPPVREFFFSQMMGKGKKQLPRL